MTASSKVLVWCVLLAGCVVAPVQEMSNARQAIAVADRAVAGHESGAQSLAQARAALVDAETLLHQHAFREARDQAIKARQLAVTAKEAAQEAGKPSTRSR